MSTSDMITLPRAERDLLMLLASWWGGRQSKRGVAEQRDPRVTGDETRSAVLTFSLSPAVLASLCRSEPARSTRLRREVLILATDSLLSCVFGGREGGREGTSSNKLQKLCLSHYNAIHHLYIQKTLHCQ